MPQHQHCPPEKRRGDKSPECHEDQQKDQLNSGTHYYIACVSCLSVLCKLQYSLITFTTVNVHALIVMYHNEFATRINRLLSQI
jgi:hypothetical protein